MTPQGTHSHRCEPGRANDICTSRPRPRVVPLEQLPRKFQGKFGEAGREGTLEWPISVDDHRGPGRNHLGAGPHRQCGPTGQDGVDNHRIRWAVIHRLDTTRDLMRLGSDMPEGDPRQVERDLLGTKPTTLGCVTVQTDQRVAVPLLPSRGPLGLVQSMRRKPNGLSGHSTPLPREAATNASIGRDEHRTHIDEVRVYRVAACLRAHAEHAVLGVECDALFRNEEVGGTELGCHVTLGRGGRQRVTISNAATAGFQRTATPQTTAVQVVRRCR